MKKWFIYTVLAGLIPTLTKIIVFIRTDTHKSFGECFEEGDIVTFGLILVITNFNELLSVNKSINTKIDISISMFALLFIGFIFFDIEKNSYTDNAITSSYGMLFSIGLVLAIATYSFFLMKKLTKNE